MTKSILSVLLAVAACGGGDDGGGTPDAAGSGGGGSATCNVAATAMANTTNRTITGVGTVQCDVTAGLSLNVCVQWNPDGTFKDIMCQSSNMSGVKDLRVENVSSCGIATGRKFRTRVSASVNSAAKPEVLSAEIGCE